jgi:hypothetical protein
VAGASRVPCRVVRKKGAHRSARRGVLQHARSGFFGRPGSPLRPRLAPKASRERQAPPFSPFATPRPARGRRERRGRPVVVPTVRTGASRRRLARPSAGAAPCPTPKTPLERAPRGQGCRNIFRTREGSQGDRDRGVQYPWRVRLTRIASCEAKSLTTALQSFSIGGTFCGGYPPSPTLPLELLSELLFSGLRKLSPRCCRAFPVTDAIGAR